MGRGVDADVSGFNSSASFDGGVDWEAEGGPWARFLYDGMTQLSRQPWFTVDRCGNRLRYMDSRVKKDGGDAIYALGDLATIQMTPPGHRGYIIFDGNYEDHLAGFAQEHCRKLITPDLEQIDKVPEHYRDWHHGVQDAIDADVLKKRDTLEELERDLGFEEGVLVEAVRKWNETCARGEDDFMYPMPPEWLHEISTPPSTAAASAATCTARRPACSSTTRCRSSRRRARRFPACTPGGTRLAARAARTATSATPSSARFWAT